MSLLFEMAATTADKILNVNVGVMGHIDSGKTSLAKALSTVASTACFDKNPQSKERGITLDLGFSSFLVDIPEHLKSTNYQKLQYTLVDCPGHASLIRTIIGGASIIDMIMLVIDVTKGIQTQTAECLIIGEIACEKMVVVLNKIDLLPQDKCKTHIEKMTKRLLKTLEKTKFANSPIISVAAKPGGSEKPETEATGVKELIDLLNNVAFLPKRSPEGPFVFAVDHCFSIRGQGTVMTGTVLAGQVIVGDNVEIASMKMARKVKSMQMFHVPVEKAIQGDRVGICVTQFDPKLLERGLVCTPNSLSNLHAAIISVKRISYFKGSISTKAKFHISLGHETVMAKVHFFNCPSKETETEGFDFDTEYLHLDELGNDDKEQQNEKTVLVSDAKTTEYALLEFEKTVTAALECIVIGSRLDSDIHQNTCRLAFQGNVLCGFEDKNYRNSLKKLKVYKLKKKEGVIERMMNEQELIGRGLFKKETNIQQFSGLKITLSTGEKGIIEGAFGQSGKIKIRIQEPLKDTTLALLEVLKKKGKAKDSNLETDSEKQPVKVILNFKRYIYDTQKKIIQTS